MDDLGKHLKAERIRQKVSVDEIASHTKIPIRFIQAIEANQFDQIPNIVAAKGFLRGYVQFLGLDTAEISEAFDEMLRPMKKGSSAREKQDEILAYLQVKRPSRLPFPRRVILLIGGVILLLLIFVSLLPERKDSLRTPAPPPLPENQITTREDKPVGDEVLVEEIQTTETPTTVEETASTLLEEDAIQKNAEVEREKVLTAAKLNPEKKEKPASPADEEPSMHVLYVEAIEPTWVQVEIDGDEIREALLQPNDSIRWKAKEKFLLKVGNAGGVKVRLNGKELGPLGRSGDVVEKEIFGVTEKTE